MNMNKHHRPLRRHRDDDYVDRVEIQSANGWRLIGDIRPRYKTSGMSGDEWRISAQLSVRLSSTHVFDRVFGRMDDLQTYAGLFLRRHVPECMDAPMAVLTAYRKGHVLMIETFLTFGEAAIGMKWHIVSANEGRKEVTWYHLSDAEEAQHCQQVGCAETPINVFRLKKLMYGSSDPERTFLPPKYDFEGQWVWYCARHTQRGDCGYEDADANLELVEGPGVARPLAGDFSPSGLVVLGNEDDGEGD
jgi:hypothetical protein